MTTIAVNTRLLLKDKLEGIGWFSFETLRRITSSHPEVKFIFLFDRPFDPSFIFSDNITPVIAGPPARHPVLFYLWFEYAVPRILRKVKPDLFLSPDGYLSLSTDVASLPVIHDLNFEHFPQDLPWIIRKYYRYYFPRFARKASRIITVSEFSKADIHERYGIGNDIIDVVYNGANENFTPSPEHEMSETRARFSSGDPYFVFVGSLHPRKNLKNLFRAFDLFRDTHNKPHKLIIAGSRKWWTDEMNLAYLGMKHKEEVIFTGRLPEKDLVRVVSAAHALVYVSNFEGFGIPILEAFYSGVPVITSNLTSMPEVAGDAALFADPYSPESIAEKMRLIMADEKLRKDLVARGLERAKKFSWDATAARVWTSVEKCLSASTQ